MRLVQYSKRGWHFYCIDFCYYVTLLVLLFINFHPKNEIMFRNAFLFSNGMTGMAICIFNNQLVFHRIDYLVSLAVHAVPMLTMTRIRWYNIPREAELPLEQRTFATLEDTSKMSWFEFNRAMFALPILAYLVWVTIWLLIL